MTVAAKPLLLSTAESATGAVLDRRREFEQGRCQRWPEGLRLLSSHGELVKGRCKATNLCVYCQRLYVRETVEALILDALDGEAPGLWLVLTAREHLTRAELSVVLRHLRRVLRRRWPGVEWFVQVEFQRRGALHANLLIKGVAAVDGDELLRLAAEEWCLRVDALPVGQWLAAIGASEVVARYLGKMLGHGLKQEQAPPLGWKGHRTSQTRGYFPQGAVVIRQRARESLARSRAVAVAVASGLDAHDAELAAHEAMRTAARTSWVLANERGVRLSASPVPQHQLHWRAWYRRRNPLGPDISPEWSRLPWPERARRLLFLEQLLGRDQDLERVSCGAARSVAVATSCDHGSDRPGGWGSPPPTPSIGARRSFVPSARPSAA